MILDQEFQRSYDEPGKAVIAVPSIIPFPGQLFLLSRQRPWLVRWWSRGWRWFNRRLRRHLLRRQARHQWYKIKKIEGAGQSSILVTIHAVGNLLSVQPWEEIKSARTNKPRAYPPNFGQQPW
jgi:hypothetical protein